MKQIISTHSNTQVNPKLQSMQYNEKSLSEDRDALYVFPFSEDQDALSVFLRRDARRLACKQITVVSY